MSETVKPDFTRRVRGAPVDNRFHPVNVEIREVVKITPNITLQAEIINLTLRIREYERDVVTIDFEQEMKRLNTVIENLQAENTRLKSQIELLTNR